MFFRHQVNIKIRSNAVWARHIETQNTVDLLSPQPFTTARMLVGQKTIAAEFLKSVMRECIPRRRLVSPNVLIQPLEYVNDGLSEVEEQVFSELGLCAGGFQAAVWVGAHLSDMQVVEKF